MRPCDGASRNRVIGERFHEDEGKNARNTKDHFGCFPRREFSSPNARGARPKLYLTANKKQMPMCVLLFRGAVFCCCIPRPLLRDCVAAFPPVTPCSPMPYDHHVCLLCSGDWVNCFEHLLFSLPLLASTPVTPFPAPLRHGQPLPPAIGVIGEVGVAAIWALHSMCSLEAQAQSLLQQHTTRMRTSSLAAKVC